MASTDARPIPRKNTAFRLYFGIRDYAGNLQASASFKGLSNVTGKAILSKDGATAANSTNSIVEISHGAYYLDLEAGEMNYDAVVVVINTDTDGAKNELVVLYPEEAGDVRLASADIAGAVWNASLTTYDTTGTFGESNQLPP